ncbi:hypothetical protein OC861_000124 [Tilletia horrida]|nr:hypothetical protein OC845_002054 [Tilletia horrida]KAK0570175.1 hypothetical protein OC861_000124 [Tilletia horrida]
MAATAWQTLINQRLQERDVKENQHDLMIQHYERLAKHTYTLTQRNRALLRAAAAGAGSSISSNPNGVASSASTPGAVTPAIGATGPPANAAYVATLESQLGTLREELAELYKTQGQNAQRLLVMNETLRERQDAERLSTDELRNVREERDRLSRKAQDYAEAMVEKDKSIQVLQDELNTLSLELGQVELRNEHLTKDNAALLQRWLDRVQDEANQLNDANDFVREVEKKRGAADTPPANSAAAK